METSNRSRLGFATSNRPTRGTTNFLLYPPDDESGGYFGSACGPRPSSQVCERASMYSFDPIVFKFGVGICFGKGTKPIVFDGNPESKMAAGGHVGKKFKTSDFCFKKCFTQFQAKNKSIAKICLLNFFFAF